MSQWTGPKRAEVPMKDSEQLRKGINRHCSLPVTEADLKALNERVTELCRKMTEPNTHVILECLHENGEFLWADEAHVEGALLRLQTAQASEPTLEQLQDQARELFNQAYKLAEKAKALVAPTDVEWDEAYRMVNEMMSDCSNDYPNTGTADGLWDVIDQVLETRREEAEEEGQGA